MSRIYKPRGVVVRNHPQAHKIALEIIGPLMALRSRRLIADIMQARDVGRTTAQKAVSLARESA